MCCVPPNVDVASRHRDQGDLVFSPALTEESNHQLSRPAATICRRTLGVMVGPPASFGDRICHSCCPP
jgi:hypothetical protein